MNQPDPIPLVVAGKDKVVAFACGKCKTVASSPEQFIGDAAETLELAREAARTHCGPWHCACGAERGQYRTLCDACTRAEYARRDREREAICIAKATPVRLEDYGEDMVYVDGGDYLSAEELQDRIADGEAPELVWGCTEIGLSLDAERVIRDALELGEHHEDAHEGLAVGAEKALQRALNEWRDKYAAKVRTYMVDHSVRVVWEENSDVE